MRISDWSSDVCSSDLAIAKAHVQQAERPIPPCCAAQKIEGWPVCQSRGIDAPQPAKHFPIDWLGQIRRIYLLPFLGAVGEIAHHGRENRTHSSASPGPNPIAKPFSGTRIFRLSLSPTITL